MELKDLTPNPRNPRKITDQKLIALKKAMLEFGDLGGIVFNKTTGRLAGGHQRTKVLPPDSKIIIQEEYFIPTEVGTSKIGHVLINGERFSYREVDWSEEKEKAANIAANKGAGDWDWEMLGDWFKDLDQNDFDLDLTMFDEEERARFFVEPEVIEEGLTDPDSIPEEVETRCKPGDLWLLGNHRLLCGDSTNIQHVERLLNGEKIALCFTSPPYSDQRDYNGDKELSTEHLASFIRCSFSQVDIFAINLGISRKESEVIPYWDDYIKEAKDCDLKLLSWNVWNRENAASIGQATAMFPIAHEWIFIFGKAPKELNRTVEKNYDDKRKKGKRRQKDGSFIYTTHNNYEKKKLTTVLTMDFQRYVGEDHKHPAMFPIELPSEYLLACTNPNENVYEPFCGSGTTLISCEKHHRNAFGMELDPKYCDVIISRWEKFTGQEAILADKGEEG